MSVTGNCRTKRCGDMNLSSQVHILMVQEENAQFLDFFMVKLFVIGKLPE